MFDLVNKHGPIERKKLQELCGCSDKLLTNFLHTYKQRGLIIRTGPGTYDVAGKKETKKIAVAPLLKLKKKANKTVKKVVKAPKNVSKSEPIRPAVEYIKPVKKSEYKDSEGTELFKGDRIELLDSSSKTEDDILNFPTEFCFENGILLKWEMGSSMVTIKLTQGMAEGKELLVYPHWLKKITN